MDKVIVTCALTGAQQGREANPNLPEQPCQIVQQALDAWRAGAAIVHIHARDNGGNATSDVNVFREIVAGIREAGSDLVINLTTGGSIAGLPLAQRIAVVPELKPEIASFSVGSSMVGRWNPQAGRWERQFNLAQSYDDLAFIARTMLENGTRPELEVYDLGMLNNIEMLLEAGLLRTPLWINLVTGIAGQNLRSTPENLAYLVSRLPADACWTVSGIGGRHHWRMAAMALAMGGHVRTGLEDNVYVEKGVLAGSNAQLVEKLVLLARIVGREPVTPAEARTMLKLQGSR